MQMVSIDFAGTILAALLTIMVLSYLIGDNPLYRIATSIFIGVAAGYAGAAAWHYVLRPSLLEPLSGAVQGIGAEEGRWVVELVLAVIPLVLTGLLMFKSSPVLGRLGNIPIALMTGVGAAVVVGGAVTGTLIPQAEASMVNLSPSYVDPVTGEQGMERMINVVILLVGALTTLLYFQFSVGRKNAVTGERSPVMEIASRIGSGFIAVTFGVMYAGLLLATTFVLAERVRFLIDVVFQMFLI